MRRPGAGLQQQRAADAAVVGQQIEPARFLQHLDILCSRM